MSEQVKKLVPKLRFPEFYDSGKWPEYRLENFATFYKGKGVSKVDIDLKGKTPCIRYGELYTHYSEVINNVISRTNLPENELFFSKSNDVIIPASGETKWDIAKASCVMLDDVALGGDLNVIRTNQNGVFISYYLNGAKKYEISKVAQGDSVVHLYSSQLKLINLFLPPKPEEQQKIADCLYSVDDLITAQTQKVEALKQYRKGLMQQLFPAEGETIPKLRFPEFESDGEWQIKALSKVCKVLQGYGFPEVLQGKKEGVYPFAKVSDISKAVAEKGGFLAEATNYIDEGELLKLRAKLIPVGSTVFAKIGEALRLNRRAYVQKACLIDNNTTGLKAIDGVAVDYFVYLLSQLIDLNDHCGGAVPSVNKTTLEEIKVVIPKPTEQQRIADCLSSLDDLISTQTQNLEAYKVHKKGLMQQLFPSLDEGEV